MGYFTTLQMNPYYFTSKIEKIDSKLVEEIESIAQKRMELFVKEMDIIEWLEKIVKEQLENEFKLSVKSVRYFSFQIVDDRVERDICIVEFDNKNLGTVLFPIEPKEFEYKEVVEDYLKFEGKIFSPEKSKREIEENLYKLLSDINEFLKKSVLAYRVVEVLF